MLFTRSTPLPAVMLFLLLLACVVVSPACSQQQESDPALAARMEALEQRVQKLESTVAAREAQIQALREDLKSVTTYVNLALDNLADAAGGVQSGEGDGSAEGYARKALEKSLDDLRKSGKELLRRLEEELDRGLGPQDEAIQ